jgi:hypothetical protein
VPRKILGPAALCGAGSLFRILQGLNFIALVSDVQQTRIAGFAGAVTMTSM